MLSSPLYMSRGFNALAPRPTDLSAKSVTSVHAVPRCDLQKRSWRRDGSLTTAQPAQWPWATFQSALVPADSGSVYPKDWRDRPIEATRGLDEKCMTGADNGVQKCVASRDRSTSCSATDLPSCTQLNRRPDQKASIVAFSPTRKTCSSRP
jgi:hypothetical protein